MNSNKVIVAHQKALAIQTLEREIEVGVRSATSWPEHSDTYRLQMEEVYAKVHELDNLRSFLHGWKVIIIIFCILGYVTISLI